MRQLALVLCFLGSSCFSAGEPPLRCSAERPGCPSGFVCVADNCVKDADDLGQAVDMTTNDLTKPVSLCADGLGSPIGTMGAWACPGTFGAGKASSQCKNQKACADSTLIPESVSLGIDNFFISQSWGGTNKLYQTPAVSECTKITFPNSAGYYGCGKGGGIVNTACNGFRAIIVCDPMYKITCGNTGIDFAVNTNPQNGVLCCP